MSVYDEDENTQNLLSILLTYCSENTGAELNEYATKGNRNILKKIYLETIASLENGCKAKKDLLDKFYGDALAKRQANTDLLNFLVEGFNKKADLKRYLNTLFQTEFVYCGDWPSRPLTYGNFYPVNKTKVKESIKNQNPIAMPLDEINFRNNTVSYTAANIYADHAYMLKVYASDVKSIYSNALISCVDYLKSVLPDQLRARISEAFDRIITTIGDISEEQRKSGLVAHDFADLKNTKKVSDEFVRLLRSNDEIAAATVGFTEYLEENKQDIQKKIVDSITKKLGQYKDLEKIKTQTNLYPKTPPGANQSISVSRTIDKPQSPPSSSASAKPAAAEKKPAPTIYSALNVVPILGSLLKPSKTTAQSPAIQIPPFQSTPLNPFSSSAQTRISTTSPVILPSPIQPLIPITIEISKKQSEPPTQPPSEPQPTIENLAASEPKSDLPTSPLSPPQPKPNPEVNPTQVFVEKQDSAQPEPKNEIQPSPIPVIQHNPSDSDPIPTGIEPSLSLLPSNTSPQPPPEKIQEPHASEIKSAEQPVIPTADQPQTDVSGSLPIIPVLKNSDAKIEHQQPPPIPEPIPILQPSPNLAKQVPLETQTQSPPEHPTPSEFEQKTISGESMTRDNITARRHPTKNEISEIALRRFLD